MAAHATLHLDNMTIDTTDPVCVRALWSLMATAVTPDDSLALNGREPVPIPDDRR